MKSKWFIFTAHLGGGFAGVVLSPVLKIKLENSNTGDLTSYTVKNIKYIYCTYIYK